MGDTTGSTRAKAVRRFTLFDAIVLIAATAVGIAGMRCYWLSGNTVSLSRPEGGWSTASIVTILYDAASVSLPLLVAWTLAVFALRLRSPRPRLRQLAVQPGTAACIIAMTGLMAGVLELIVRFTVCRVVTGEDPLKEFFPHPPAYLAFSTVGERDFYFLGVLLSFMFASNAQIAFGVVVAWIILAWSRRCRPESSWIDRAGRVMGVTWITAALFLWLSRLIIDML
jgi:hypothetical protein